ncbi:MAG: HRDC domain-containing protein, partial [Nitrospirota bacterium]|nr:HRDC domain-containing protein [Nitrospirota bacterium]
LKQAGEYQPDSPVKKVFRERAAPVVAPRASLADPQLFERLRQLRTELAEEEGVASFVIFHDKTLKAIASHKPVTPAALLEIPGIGPLKAERYGRRVLAVVNEPQ